MGQICHQFYHNTCFFQNQKKVDARIFDKMTKNAVINAQAKPKGMNVIKPNVNPTDKISM